MEEKRLYELTISPKFEKALPPLQEAELSQLREKLLTEGCRDALVVFHGTLIDGHSRYRICHECGIPFAITELEREDEEEAYLWVVENQLGRRNVSDFAKCELVLHLEPKLREEAKRRQGWRKNEADLPQNSAERGEKGGDLPQKSAERDRQKETREILSKMAGVSRDTLTKVKKLLESAPSETLEQLRTGDLSVNKAYTLLFKPDEERTSPPRLIPKEPTPARKPLFPGYGLVSMPAPTQDKDRIPPPDSVYDIPPVQVFANSPIDDLAFREEAEIRNAVAELSACTVHYVRRIGEILRSMTVASASEENMDKLMQIVTSAYENIEKMMKNGGKENEESDA